MCRNGLYRERGIKELDGYAAERFRIDPDFAVRLDRGLGDLGVLVEPASVIAKVFDQAWRLGGRSAHWRPRRLLVTGAGPVGLLAALFGRLRGLEVSMFDRVQTGTKPHLARAIGAAYYGGTMPDLGQHEPDLIIECTGASEVIAEVVTRSAAAGLVCLAGLSSGHHVVNVDFGAIGRELVLENDVVFGSVSANRAHYETAADTLAAADRSWLNGLISRRVALGRWREAFERREDDVKVVLDFKSAA
jgi:threonine dehydrogenase-like Zn-dependent dehydrogenase